MNTVILKSQNETKILFTFYFYFDKTRHKINFSTVLENDFKKKNGNNTPMKFNVNIYKSYTFELIGYVFTSDTSPTKT